MKSILPHIRQFTLPLAAALALHLTPALFAQANADADKAWREVESVSKPPAPPAEWQAKRPSPEEIAKFRDKQKELVVIAADKARDFYTKYPQHPKAADAKKKEYELLGMAARMGVPTVADRLSKLDAEKLKDPSLTEDERFKIRTQQVEQLALSLRPKGPAAMFASYESGARALQKDFPRRPEVWEMLLEVASNSDDGAKALAIAKEILAGNAPDEVKGSARTLLKKMEAVGKPLPIKFTAVDGREVDLAKLAGKVVLLDFWATWCGPCVAELPNVKAAYDKLSPQGFEIVGISFDQDKEKLTAFVAKEKMSWPQFFDGQGWQNKFGQEYGINSIPSMWLVDKKGNLRDLNGREDLVAKVEKLLAEK